MRASALKYTILSWVSSLTMVIFLIIPFHAFVTVWGSSFFGHYTALRLWKEGLLLVCGLGVLFLVVTDQKIRSHTLTRRLVWLMFAYIALNLIWAGLALIQHDVTLKAALYGLAVDLRYLFFFLITWSVALRLGRLRANWQWLVLWPAAAVVVIGLLQALVLPDNILSHFGYGPHTIAPIETINHNQHYHRVMSTLRGANPLGAYLIIPISILSVLVVQGKQNSKQLLLLAGSIIVLFLSFSRSAWIGAVFSVGTVLAVSLKSSRARRQAVVVVGLGVAILLSVGLTLRHNSRFENLIFHTETHSITKTSSNQGHAKAFKQGLKEVVHQPLGRGPGTAGPASTYNQTDQTMPRIAENYYVQIGQESGWIGLGLFGLINLGVAYLLWLRRRDPLALSLFASFVGLVFVNLLSHAWTDDTLAYLWWGLAGIAMVSPPSHDGKKP